MQANKQCNMRCVTVLHFHNRSLSIHNPFTNRSMITQAQHLLAGSELGVSVGAFVPGSILLVATVPGIRGLILKKIVFVGGQGWKSMFAFGWPRVGSFSGCICTRIDFVGCNCA